MSRRAFLAAGAAAAVLAPLPSWGDDLSASVSSLRGVGSPLPGALRLLVSPGCLKAIPLVRSLLRHPSGLLVVPFDPRPSMDGAIGAFLDEGAPEDVLRLLEEGEAELSDLSGSGRDQRETFRRHVALALVTATGRPPTSPTTLVPTRSGMRVLRGAPEADDLNEFMDDLNRASDTPPWVANPSLFPT